MGEKIIQPPFYNSGFYNTGAGGGGGGGGGFFNKDISFATCSNIGIYPSEDKIKNGFESGGGTGGFVTRTNLYNNDLNIDFCIKYNRNSSGGSDYIVSYNSTNSNFNDGRLFTIRHDWSSGLVNFQVATSSTSWNTLNYNVASGSGVNKFNVQIKKHGTNLDIKFFINGVKKYDNTSVDYTNGVWCPSFFMENTYQNQRPSTWGLKTGEYIILSETYLIVNDVKIFGT